MNRVIRTQRCRFALAAVAAPAAEKDPKAPAHYRRNPPVSIDSEVPSMRDARTVVVFLLLSALACAQAVDGYMWATYILPVGAPCQLCVHDTAGNVVAGFPHPNLAGAALTKQPGGVVWTVDAGNLWTTHGGLFSGTVTVAKRSPTGVFQFSVTLPNVFLPLRLTADPSGNAWLIDGTNGKLWRISSTGTLTGPFGGNTGQSGGFGIDPAGNLWKTSAPSGGTPQIRKYTNAGTLILTTPETTGFRACTRRSSSCSIRRAPSSRMSAPQIRRRDSRRATERASTWSPSPTG
jgi:hypothetical protein